MNLEQAVTIAEIRTNVMYLLLIGGNKRTQTKDIQIAKHLAKNI